MKLSILDQVPVPKNSTSTQALQNSVLLAQLGDELGYTRMWLAEHHNTHTLASSAPEVTASYLAAKTSRIRLGTGGVMMMHYSPLKIAEVFKTLSALNNNRIDLGIGRAPGGDGAAITALASGRRPDYSEQYDKIQVILNLIEEKPTNEPIYDAVLASPLQVNLPSAWLLGSSGQSARQAGQLGLGYSFAQFFNGQMSREIFDTYKNSFIPSSFMEKPTIITTYATCVAETKEEAEYLSMPMQISRLHLMQGKIQPMLSVEEANNYPLTEMEKIHLEHNRSLSFIGEAKEVAELIKEEQFIYGFDEAMINSNLYTIEQRLNNYRLLAKYLI